MEPAPGLMVTQNLRLVELLGQGGMGSVWVADHLGLDTRVAIKFISADVTKKNPTLLERFKREAALAARIKSPHVVQMFDHGFARDGMPYIAMELLEGQSLKERLEHTGTLSVRECALLVAQCAQVLSRAHDLGVVHRDIKPGNIFLVNMGYEMFVKVLDFGIAKHTDTIRDMSVTSTGAMLGSPLYMSPEQFTDAKEVDRRADLWSLAVVAYHALTGRPSFKGDTLGQVMMSVMSRTYETPCSQRSDLPRPLDAFFAKAFAENIDHRFQTAEELTRAFDAVARGSADVHATLAATGENDLAKTVNLHTDDEPRGAPSSPAAHPSWSQPAVPAGTFEPSASAVHAKPRGQGGAIAAVIFSMTLMVGAAAVGIYFMVGSKDAPASAAGAPESTEDARAQVDPEQAEPAPSATSSAALTESSIDDETAAETPSAEATASASARAPTKTPTAIRPQTAGQPKSTPRPPPPPPPKPKEQDFGF